MSNERPVLHDYWRSSASYRVRLALNIKGIDYQAHSVNLLTKEQQEASHITRNPQGLVPVLDMDGLRLTQSLAIIEYLDDRYPQPALLPAAPDERHRVRALSHIIAMEIHPVCNLSVVAHVVELAGGGEETRVTWMKRFIAKGLGAFEVLLDHRSTGRFCHGDSPTMADCCLVPQLYNAERWGLKLSTWPRIAAIHRECRQLDAFKAAHPDQIGPPDAQRS